MSQKSSPKREKIKCPLCAENFIPESFHLEGSKLTSPEYTSERIKGMESAKQLRIKPLTIIKKFWVTNCPSCGYIVRFLAGLDRKELLEDNDKEHKVQEFKEFNKKYYYRHYSVEKPYMDHSDYFVEKIKSIENDIKNALTTMKLEEWGSLYRDWRSNKTIDTFKFLVKFITKLEEYYKNTIKNDNDRKMPVKIKELNFPKELEESLIEVNHLRNMAVHDDYELSKNNEDLIDETVFQLVSHLIEKQLKPLDLNNIEFEDPLNLFDKNQIKWEIRGFLHVYIAKYVRFEKQYERLLIPLIEKLGIVIEDP